MEAFLIIESDLIIFVLGLMMLLSIRLKTGKLSYENNWIMLLLGLILILQLLLASFWALSLGRGAAVVVLRNIVFFVYYIFNNLMPLLWALYVYVQVARGKKNIILLGVFAVPFMLSLILLILNPFLHDIYLIDSSNIYRTGSMFYLNVALCYLYLLIAQIIPYVYRKRIKKRRFTSLMMFSLPPLVGSVIQFAFGGIDLIWSCSVLSIFIIFLCSLNDRMNLDYLTGIYNRMQADIYIEKKIEKSTSLQTFSGILIDIDKFKEINDKFGHHSGDEALEITARLLKKSIGKKDFLARIGGDEFLIVLYTDDLNLLKLAVNVINQAFENFNRVSQRPFELKLSMGYDVYDYTLNMTRQQFIRHIDRLMYRKKHTRKSTEELAVGTRSIST